MPVHLINRRPLPQRCCPLCDYDIQGQPIEGQCPECGCEYGFTCRRCGELLSQKKLRSVCIHCNAKFDKSDERTVYWGTKHQRDPWPTRVMAGAWQLVRVLAFAAAGVAAGVAVILGVFALLYLVMGPLVIPFVGFMLLVVLAAPGVKRPL